MVTIIPKPRRTLLRAHPHKLVGFDVAFNAGDLYVILTGFPIRLTTPGIRRVYKVTGGGVTSLHTYHVVPCSESANTFRVRFYREPAHTEVPNATDLSAELAADESLNFIGIVD